MRQTKYEYDAFISHAVEDKIPIANELCAKLERAGLKIWYSGKELGIGDSIEKTIERGLHRSRYGIVILSPTYLAKNWTIREFYTLLAKEIEEHKVILPVLYNIGLDELKKKDLLMADRFAVNADRGLDFVVDKLVGEIRKQKVVEKKVAWFSKMWLLLILSLLANITFVLRSNFPASGKAALVSPDQMALAAMHAFAGQKIFSKIQYMATQVPGCTCETREKGQTFARKASFEAVPAGHSADPQPEQSLSGRGSRMTMAVFFQFEAAPESPPETDKLIENMPESIKPHSSEPLLISMSKDATPSGGFQTVCAHSDHQ